MRSYLKRHGDMNPNGSRQRNLRQGRMSAVRARSSGSGPNASSNDFGVSNQAMQRMLSFGPAPQIQRQPTAHAAAPTYPDCTATVTGISHANERLERARLRARDFVQVAVRALGRAHPASSAEATALARHFINPTAAQRATIRDNYKAILTELNAGNFVCSTQDICGTFQAFWLEADDLIHVCPDFWKLKYPCPPIVLIHEAAHDIGVDVSITGHTMNRGSASYPAGSDLPPEGETAADRIINPDAYGFYAAHIWRETDTSIRCGEPT